MAKKTLIEFGHESTLQSSHQSPQASCLYFSFVTSIHITLQSILEKNRRMTTKPNFAWFLPVFADRTIRMNQCASIFMQLNQTIKTQSKVQVLHFRRIKLFLRWKPANRIDEMANEKFSLRFLHLMHFHKTKRERKNQQEIEWSSALNASSEPHTHTHPLAMNIIWLNHGKWHYMVDLCANNSARFDSNFRIALCVTVMCLKQKPLTDRSIFVIASTHNGNCTKEKEREKGRTSKLATSNFS